MALRVCCGEGGCGTKYAVGLSRCPHCLNAESREEGEEPMPKITRHGGPTIAGAEVIGGAWGDDTPEPETASVDTPPQEPPTEDVKEPAPAAKKTTSSRRKPKPKTTEEG